jgi:hypothetical protein
VNFHPPQFQTILFVWIFFVAYLVFLIKQAILNRMDVYDFLFLAAVGLIPSIFVSFPKLTYEVSHLLGVEFPFVILFGSLIFILFLLIYQLIRRTMILKKCVIELTQSLALRYREIEK